MKKHKIIALLLFMFIFMGTVKAEDCTFETGYAYPDKYEKVACFSNYNDAKNAANGYSSKIDKVAVVKKSGSYVWAKYAIDRVDFYNGAFLDISNTRNTHIYTTSEGAKSRAGSGSNTFMTYINGAWGSDSVFLDYNDADNTTKVKISGVTGWIMNWENRIEPLSTHLTNHIVFNTDIAVNLRTGAGTGYPVVNGAHSTNYTKYVYYPSETKEADGYTWYKVQYSDTQVGYFASKSGWSTTSYDFSLDTYYYVSNNTLYHRINKAGSNDVTNTLGTAPFVYKSKGVKTYYLNENRQYYSFDGNYFYSDPTVMIDDYMNNNYNNAINKDYPYFAYFQYLPSHSKTGYTAEYFDQMVKNQGYTGFPSNPASYVDSSNGAFIKDKGKLSMMYGTGKYFINAGNTYGANALTIYSDAIRESGYGTSSIAFAKNNLFGYGASDSNPFGGAVTYNSVEDSINFHAQTLTVGTAWTDLYNYRYSGTHFGNKLSGSKRQYASDPYAGESSSKLSYFADSGIDNYANTLGIKINNNIVNIYSEADTASRVIYQTKNYANGQVLVDIPFIVDTIVTNDKGEKFYKVFTDITLDENRNYNNSKIYNFNNCYGYIRVEDLYVQNNAPVITAENKTIKLGDALDLGTLASATDYEDGNLSVSYTGEVNANSLGSYKVTYKAVDNNKFTTTKDIIVTVENNGKPIIEAEDRVVSSLTEFDEKTGVKATDSIDGDITDYIVVKSNDVKINIPGVYNITYEVTNSNGIKTTKTIKITVVANKLPVINAANKEIYIGSTFNPLEGVTATDDEDGNITDRITYESNVDTSKEGVYNVMYKVTDNANQTTSNYITVTVSAKKYLVKDNIYYLNGLTYNSNTKLVNLSGFLIIKGMNNLDSTDISYNIIFENQNNGNTIIKPLSRLKNNKPFNAPNDGSFVNTGSWFSENLDLSDLPSGDYTVYVRARSGDFETKTVLKNPFFNENVVRKFNIGNKGYSFKSNYFSKTGALELYVRESGLITNVNNPTIDNMFNQVFDMSLSGSNLRIKASSHNVKGNYSNSTNIARYIYLENIDTNKVVKEYNVGSINNGPYAITLKSSDGYDKTRAWYDTTLDLSDIPVGKYSIIVRTKTGFIDDYGEIYDLLFKDINFETNTNGKTYKVIRNDNLRFRIELIVS